MALTRIGLNQSINLASNVTGTLPTGNGGTGATSFAPGKVLQVVNATNSTQITMSTGSYTWTDNISLAITPSSTSSKILIVGAQNLAAGINDKYINGTFFRDSTNLGHYQFGISGGSLTVNGTFVSANWGASYLDSPSSSSQISYYMKGAAQSVSGGSMFINVNGSHANLTLMEIAG
jgi:hypothetical protein